MIHMIHFVKGNIFDSTAQVIVNPVNCVGVMGAGLAKQFKERYPNMYRSYIQCCAKGLLQPGKLMLCKAEDHMILLFPTKTYYSMPSKMEYIEKGLEKLADTYQQKNIQSIAIPKLGCGLGGLDWPEVRQRILYYLTDCDMDVYVYE